MYGTVTCSRPILMATVMSWLDLEHVCSISGCVSGC